MVQNPVEPHLHFTRSDSQAYRIIFGPHYHLLLLEREFHTYPYFGNSKNCQNQLLMRITFQRVAC